MNVTVNVITDLLPLYLAGEASADTRALLEEYLRQHPAFAASVQAHAQRSAAMLAALPMAPPPDHERATLEKSRKFARTRSQVLAFSLACTLIPLAFSFKNGAVQWIMLRDNPTMAVLFFVAAAACWLAYVMMGRRVQVAS